MTLNKSYNYHISTIGNINVTGLTAGTINVSGLSSLTNTTATNVTSTNVVTTAITSGSILATTSVSSGMLAATNATVTNIVATNATSTNVVATALTSGSLLATTSVSSGMLAATNATVTNIVATNATSTNVVATIITSGSILATTSVSSGMLAATNATATNITATNIIVTNSTSTNIVATNATSTNVVATALTSGSILATTSVSSGILAATNAIATNATATNIVSTNISTGVVIASSGLTVGNINFTGSLYQNGSVYSGSTMWTIASGNIYTTAGNVGIGTTNPSNILQVGNAGRLRISNGTSDYTLLGTLDTDSTTNTRIVVSGNTRSGSEGCIENVCTGTGSHLWYTTNSVTQRMRLTSAGNLGIGTDSPTEKLSIFGSNPSVSIYGSEGETTSLFLGLPYQGNRANGLKTAIIAKTALGYGWNRADLHFCSEINASHGGNADVSNSRMMISGTTGNIGINTTTPQYNLDVNGTLNATNTTTTNISAGYIINTGTGTINANGGVFLAPPRNNLYVAVGNSIAASSPDGVTWTQRALPISANWFCVTANPSTGVYVALAADSSIAASSPDGITWTQRALPVSARWCEVTVNPTTGVFVAIASNSSIAASSTDGITWTQRTLPVSIEWTSVTVNPTTGVFVAVSQYAISSTVAASSTDGITWTQRSLPVSAGWNSVTVNPTTGVFVAIAYSSSIAASSTDGINWTQRSLPVTANWLSVTVNPTTGVFVAIAYNSSIAASSTNGIDWTLRSLPVTANWASVTVNKITGVFVAAAENSSIAASSTNGIDWTQRSLPVSAWWSSVTAKATHNVLCIGTSSPNPNYQLHAVGTTSLPPICAQSDAQFANLSIKNSSASGKEYFAGSDNSGCFYIYDNTASAFRMTVNNSGYIGIGTTNPSLALHVKASNVGDTICIENSNASGYAAAQFKTPSTSFVIGVGGQSESQTSYRDKLYFVNGGNGQGMWMDTLGRVGITTSDPDAALQIRNSVKIDSVYIPPNPLLGLPGIWSNYGLISFPNEGYIRVSNASWFYGANGTLYGPGPYQNNSDSRIKENIVDIDDSSALDILRQIQPKRYNYVDRQNKGDSPVWGFIAQQVSSVLDYAVDTITQFIPNVYEQAGVGGDNHTITLNNKTTTDLEVSMIIRLIKTDKSSVETRITGIVDSKNFTVECDLTEDEVFVYGVQVDDFHSLNKDAIFTIATAALQEVDRELQTTKTELQSEKEKVSRLEEFIKSKFPGEF